MQPRLLSATFAKRHPALLSAFGFASADQLAVNFATSIACPANASAT